MKESSNKSISTKFLRDRAIQKLLTSTVGDGDDSECLRLLHELQIHQIELEAQNESLRTADIEMNAALQSYMELYNFSPTPYLMIGQDSRIQHANYAAVKLFGRVSFELYKLRFGAFVNYSDLPLFNAFLDEAYATSINQSCEIKLLINDTLLSVLLRTSINQQGTSLLLEVLDITERQQVAENLRKSEFLFRSQFDLGNIGIAITSPDKVWLRVNRHLSDMLGYSEAKLQSLSWAELTHPEDLDKNVAQFNKMVAGEINSYELGKRFIHSDGSIIHTHLTVSCYRGVSEIEFIIASVLDVTKRNKAEEELRQSKERYELAMKGTTDGLWDFNLVTGEIRYSQHWKSMLGYSDEEIGNDVAEWEQRLHPDDKDRALLYIAEFIEGNTAEYNIEFKMQHKCSGYIDIHSRGYGIKDESGKKTRMVGTHIDITERKLIETELAKKDERLRLSLVSSKQSWFELDLQTGEALVSRGCPEMLGYEPAEFVSNMQAWLGSLHPDESDTVMIAFNECLTTGGPVTMDYRRLKKQGGYLWISSVAEISLWDIEHKPLRMTGIHTDISERKKTEEKLKLAANVFTHIDESIMLTDAKGIIIEVNTAFTELSGYSRKEAVGCNPNMLQSGRHTPAFYGDMWKSILEQNHWKGEIWNRDKKGEVYPAMLNISAIKNAGGQITNYVGLTTDITLMKAQLMQLERNAHIDALTNLPNRALFTNRLSQAILQCGRHKRPLAVVFLDLDGFKSVNDSYGHSVGDELLIALSKRMKEVLRAGDTLARFGGDEFVAILTDLIKLEDCKPLLDRLLLAASEPVTIDDVVLNVSASIGATFYPQDNASADILLRHADQAMYVAKESGKNRYHLFDIDKSN